MKDRNPIGLATGSRKEAQIVEDPSAWPRGILVGGGRKGRVRAGKGGGCCNLSHGLRSRSSQVYIKLHWAYVPNIFFGFISIFYGERSAYLVQYAVFARTNGLCEGVSEKNILRNSLMFLAVVISLHSVR